MPNSDTELQARFEDFLDVLIGKLNSLDLDVVSSNGSETKKELTVGQNLKLESLDSKSRMILLEDDGDFTIEYQNEHYNSTTLVRFPTTIIPNDLLVKFQNRSGTVAYLDDVVGGGMPALAIDFLFETRVGFAVNGVAKIQPNPIIVGSGCFFIDNINNRIEILQEGYYEFIAKGQLKGGTATYGLGILYTPRGLHQCVVDTNIRLTIHTYLFKVDFTESPNAKYIYLEDNTTFEDLSLQMIVKKISNL